MLRSVRHRIATNPTGAALPDRVNHATRHKPNRTCQSKSGVCLPLSIIYSHMKKTRLITGEVAATEEWHGQRRSVSRDIRQILEPKERTADRSYREDEVY